MDSWILQHSCAVLSCFFLFDGICVEDILALCLKCIVDCLMSQCNTRAIPNIELMSKFLFKVLELFRSYDLILLRASVVLTLISVCCILIPKMYK